MTAGSPGDDSQFRDLLNAQHRFPLDYLHKLVGKNSPRFEAGIEGLIARFPGLVRQASRLSASGGHLSVTLIYRAENADAVVRLVRASQQIEDLVVQL